MSRQEVSVRSLSSLFFFLFTLLHQQTSSLMLKCKRSSACWPHALPITSTIHTTPAGLQAHIGRIKPGDVVHNLSRLLMMSMQCKVLLTACRYLKEDNWAPDTFGCTVKRFLLLPFLKCFSKATGAKLRLRRVHKLSALCNISAVLFGLRRLYGDIAVQHKLWGPLQTVYTVCSQT